MKAAGAILIMVWIWWSVDTLSYQDELRLEQARCLDAAELDIDMPAYCDKYHEAPREDIW